MAHKMTITGREQDSTFMGIHRRCCKRFAGIHNYFPEINIPFGQRISRLEGREVYLPAVLYRPLGTTSIRILLALPPPQKTMVLISVDACSGERAGQKAKFHTYRKMTVKSSGKTIRSSPKTKRQSQ
jgi:hypothetical protein